MATSKSSMLSRSTSKKKQPKPSVIRVDWPTAEAGASSMKDMGAVMKLAKEKLAGKTVDGKLLSDRVKGRLG